MREARGMRQHEPRVAHCAVCAQTIVCCALPAAVDRCAVPGSPRRPGRSFGRGSGFFIPEKRSVAHLRRHSRQRAPDGTKHNGLAPRREEVQKQAKQTPCCAHLPNVPHLPMSPASKPRQTLGTRARGLCPNISRATLPGKNRWAEHCPCYAIAPNLRNRRRSKHNLALDLTRRWLRTDCALHPRH